MLKEEKEEDLLGSAFSSGSGVDKSWCEFASRVGSGGGGGKEVEDEEEKEECRGREGLHI